MTRLVLLLAIVLAPVTPNADTDVVARYKIALARQDTVSLSESIDAFERIVNANGHYAQAYHQLARLYLRQNTVTARQRAEQAVRTAIRLDPDNEEYQLTLGEILWARGFRFNSSEQYRKVLKRDPENARAAYWIGFRALKQYLKYQDMAAYDKLGDETVRFEWAHFAEQDRQDAVALFQTSINADPDFADAYYQLGLAHFENSHPESLLVVCHDLLKRKPNDKNALLFSGLAFQKMDHQEGASIAYGRAIAQMPPEERAVMESVAYIAPDSVTPYLAALPAKNGKLATWTDANAQERFWRRQDPLYMTDFNERKLEHYGRVAYANLRFGRPEKDIEGWQTDMGRMYIRYGRWLSKEALRPEMSDSGATLKQPHTETWFYENYSITFLNGDGLDGWYFDNSYDYAQNYHTASPKEFAHRTTPRYIDPYRKQKYSLPNLVAAFREADSVRIEIAYALPKDKLDIAENGLFQLDAGLFLYDSGWQPAKRSIQKTTVRYPHSDLNANWRSYALDKKVLRAQPGAYTLIGEMIDPDNKSIGTFRTQRTFAFPDTGLAVSDLLLATQIQSQKAFPESRKDLIIQPAPLRTFSRSHPVFIYLEAYNLTRDTYGRTRFDIAYRLGLPDKSEIDPTLFDAQDLPKGELVVTPQFIPDETVQYDVHYKLPERHQIAQTASRTTHTGNRIETTVSAEYEGDHPEDFTFLQIDVHTLPEGIYKLTVTITDRHTNAHTNKDTLFRIIH